MQFLVVNDLHIGSKYCDNPLAKQTLDSLVNDGKTILNGDIVDMSCCPKKDVNKLREYQQQLIEKWSDKYISGNHDLRGLSKISYIAETESGERVLFTHGDLVKDFKKWSSYRIKDPGAGIFKRAWVAFADTQDWIKNKINLSNLEPMFEQAVNWAVSKNCTVVVMGHLHNTKKIEVMHRGINIIILPPGFNSLEIE